VTVGDVHWVREGDRAVPAGRTQFARDATFGYRASNLVEWVAERAGGPDALGISIEDVRLGGEARVDELLRSVEGGGVVVANAACELDLDVLVGGLLRAEAAGKRFLYRTAPSFVAARCGQATGATIGAAEIYARRPGGTGLVVAGSHVDLTARQLDRLRVRHALGEVEIDVDALLGPGRDEEIARTIAAVDASLEAGHVLLSTSRAVRTGASPAESLSISGRVSAAVVGVVRTIAGRRPLRFLLTKGGITSADIATRALDVRRATVLGQLFPGHVSVWRLDDRDGLPLVVFPGNVGTDEALADAVDVLLEEVA
jgi:uncharacterized protein YgbK (DUF1537 family)